MPFNNGNVVGRLKCLTTFPLLKGIYCRQRDLTIARGPTCRGRRAFDWRAVGAHAFKLPAKGFLRFALRNVLCSLRGLLEDFCEACIRYLYSSLVCATFTVLYQILKNTPGNRNCLIKQEYAYVERGGGCQGRTFVDGALRLLLQRDGALPGG